MKPELQSLAVQAVQALLPLLVALVGALLVYVTNYIKKKTANANIQHALDRLDDVAMGAVKEIEQSVISKLDANAPAQSYADAKAAAIASIKSHYGEKGILELQKILGWDTASLEKNLASKVEEHVHNLNHSNGVS